MSPPLLLPIALTLMGESFQGYEADFPQKASLKILN